MNRKRFTAVALVVAVAVALTGCSSGGGGGGGGGSAKKVVLTFANWQWLEKGRGDQLWAAMQEYEKVNPNVTLKKESTTSADYEKTVQTQMGAGSGPDILIVRGPLLYQLSAANLLVPLVGVGKDPYVDQETIDGKRLVYGWAAANFAFFYNKKILAAAGVQPPTTMDELLTAAKTITQKTGKPGFAFRTSTSELVNFFNDFTTWIYGYGGSWSKNDKLTINDPKNIEAAAMFKKLYDSGAMPIGDDASTFRSRFANNEIGMMFDNAPVLFTILDGNKNLTSNDVGVAGLPFPTDNSSQVRNFIGISKNSKNQDAAMGFLRWLSSADGQKVAAGGLFPSLDATAAAPPAAMVAKYPWIDVYRERAKTAKGSPIIAGFELKTPQISTVVMKAVERVLVNNEDPTKAMQEAQTAAEAL